MLHCSHGHPVLCHLTFKYCQPLPKWVQAGWFCHCSPCNLATELVTWRSLIIRSFAGLMAVIRHLRDDGCTLCKHPSARFQISFTYQLLLSSVRWWRRSPFLVSSPELPFLSWAVCNTWDRRRLQRLCFLPALRYCGHQWWLWTGESCWVLHAE